MGLSTATLVANLNTANAALSENITPRKNSLTLRMVDVSLCIVYLHWLARCSPYCPRRSATTATTARSARYLRYKCRRQSRGDHLVPTVFIRSLSTLFLSRCAYMVLLAFVQYVLRAEPTEPDSKLSGTVLLGCTKRNSPLEHTV